MIIAKVQVSGNQCTPIQVGTITKGLVGAAVSIEYTDSAWDNLRKTVVFRSYTTKDVLDAGDEVIVPAEVVARAGVQLYMGVYGVDADGSVVIPTVWASLGMVRGAAAPSGDSSTDPSLPVWARIQDAIGDMDELDTETKSNLVSAVNEVFGKCEDLAAGGAVQPDWSQNDETAADYVKNRPGGYSKLEDGTPVTRTVTCTTAITGGFKSASTMDNLWRNALGTGASMARVTYDGVDYVVEIDGSNALVGDKALEKYPFALNVSEYLGGGAYYYYDYAKTEGTHKITVTPIEETVVPIPEKYMSSIEDEVFPDTKIDTIKAQYQLKDSNGLVFRVYGGSFAPALHVYNRQWSFGGLPLIICNGVTFESTLNDNEFFTGIVFKHSGSGATYFGVTVDMTSNQINPTIRLQKISKMPGS